MSLNSTILYLQFHSKYLYYLSMNFQSPFKLCITIINVDSFTVSPNNSLKLYHSKMEIDNISISVHCNKHHSSSCLSENLLNIRMNNIFHFESHFETLYNQLQMYICCQFECFHIWLIRTIDCQLSIRISNALKYEYFTS